MQKKYSTTPEQLEMMEAGFQWKLEGYDINDVEAAFDEYTNKHDDIPAPANIIAIIENKPVYSEYMCREIQKDILCGTVFVSEAQKQYVADYKSHMMEQAGL